MKKIGKLITNERYDCSGITFFEEGIMVTFLEKGTTKLAFTLSIYERCNVPYHVTYGDDLQTASFMTIEDLHDFLTKNF